MGRHRKCWQVVHGAYGYTVTALEREPGGALYLRYWNPERDNWTWRSLRHTDRPRAEQQARELAGHILAAVTAASTGRVTVGELFARYDRDVTAHKKGAQPAEDRRRMALWQQVLGMSRDATSIDEATLARFVRDRRAGRIRFSERREGMKRERQLNANPGETTIGADIAFLHSVLNWAVKVKLPNGVRLLAENPIRGYVRPRTSNPRRPVATFDRFLLLRSKADEADTQRLFGSFLDLVEALGWRVTAICELRASDVDRRGSSAAPHGRLHKRGEVDKTGGDAWVPLSGPARAAIDRVLEVNPVIGDMPLFASPKVGTGRQKPWTRHHARALLERAERAAGLESLEGGDFHPYRRKWATERKALPARDVAAAGGWRDLRTLELCYQQTDPATMLAVATEPRKLREIPKQA